MTNIYARDVSHIKTLDPYRLQELYKMHPCAEHVVKKLLVAGEREGGKNLDTDISDCIRTLQRWQAMREEDGAESAKGLYEWKNVEPQYLWLAADNDGTVHAYEIEPRVSSSLVGAWNYDGVAGRSLQHKRIQFLSAPKVDWRNSLERRP